MMTSTSTSFLADRGHAADHVGGGKKRLGLSTPDIKFTALTRGGLRLKTIGPGRPAEQAPSLASLKRLLA
jgi:hypothetical protein